jgi:hypothetical protein
MHHAIVRNLGDHDGSVGDPDLVGTVERQDLTTDRSRCIESFMPPTASPSIDR